MHPEIPVGDIIHLQPLEIPHRFSHGRMIVRITHALESKDGIHHRRENSRQSLGLRTRAVQNPPFSHFQCVLAKWLPRKIFQPPKQIVDPDEEVFHREKMPFDRVEKRSSLHPVGIQLMELLFRRQMGGGPETSDDRKSHHNGPGPRAHLEHIKGSPIRQEKNFGRDIRQIFPGILAQHRKIEFAVRVRPRDPAQTEGCRTRFSHFRLIRSETCQFQTEISLYRCGDVAGTSWINRPTSIRQLSLQNVPDNFPFLHPIHLAPKIHQEVVITGHCGIDKQFPHPISVRFLQS